MPKQSRGIQDSTGDLRGKGEFGPVWREVSKELETSPAGDRLRDGGLGDPGPCGCCTCQADEVGETHRLHDPRLHVDVEEGSGGHPYFLVSLAEVPGPGGISVGDGHW